MKSLVKRLILEAYRRNLLSARADRCPVRALALAALRLKTHENIISWPGEISPVRTVELTFDEGMAASAAASVQMLRKIQRGRNGDHGGLSRRALAVRWGDTINGLMGEFAASRALNRAWTPGGGRISFGECAGWEVRTAWHPGDGLVIYPADNDGTYVFVCGSWPTFSVYPPILATEAKEIGESDGDLQSALLARRPRAADRPVAR